MSDHAQAEQSVQDLEMLVRHLAEELATFRRRALVAEAKLKDIETVGVGTAGVNLAERVVELERENAGLQSRLTAVTDRAQQMLDRVRFLRQQAQGSER